MLLIARHNAAETRQAGMPTRASFDERFCSATSSTIFARSTHFSLVQTLRRRPRRRSGNSGAPPSPARSEAPKAGSHASAGARSALRRASSAVQLSARHSSAQTMSSTLERGGAKAARTKPARVACSGAGNHGTLWSARDTVVPIDATTASNSSCALGSPLRFSFRPSTMPRRS